MTSLMSDSEATKVAVDGVDDLTLTQKKVQELAEAVKKLREEAGRLESNMEEMHKLQTTLYQTDLKVLEWLEAGNTLKDVQVPLERVLAFIQKEK